MAMLILLELASQNFAKSSVVVVAQLCIAMSRQVVFQSLSNWAVVSIGSKAR